MTLEEAIKENENTVSREHTNLGIKQNKAIKLGIEALKLFQKLRSYEYPNWMTKLPGETEE